MDVRGKNVLVTGANRGLGSAFVEAVIDRGACKVYCGARDPTKLGFLRQYGERAEAVQLDVTDSAQVEAAGARLKDVDLLISNAGVVDRASLMQSTLAEARRMMEVNYIGPLQLIYAFGETLTKRKGGFIYVLSLAALLPAHGAELYSASKAAGSMLGLAIHAALPDVAVSLVYPGLTDTDMVRETPMPKTPPRQVADSCIDGWLSGELSIFPDLHAELTRDALLTQAADTFRDPYKVMRDIGVRYVATLASRGLN